MRDIIDKINKINESSEPILNEDVIEKLSDSNLEYKMIGEIVITENMSSDEISRKIDEMFDGYWTNPRTVQW